MLVTRETMIIRFIKKVNDHYLFDMGSIQADFLKKINNKRLGFYERATTVLIGKSCIKTEDPNPLFEEFAYYRATVQIAYDKNKTHFSITHIDD